MLKILIELQEYLNNPDTKEQVIQKLLKTNDNKPKRAPKKSSPDDEINEKGSRPHPDDPDNPENIADFKLAYQKLTEKLATDNAEKAPKVLFDSRVLEAAEQDRIVFFYM